EATVLVNGKYVKGYINTNDVEDIVDKQETKKGWAAANPTSVYSKASKDSKVLKSYDVSSSLKFKTYTKNWYQATVYVDGKPKTGYIHKNDVTFEESANKTKYNLTLDK